MKLAVLGAGAWGTALAVQAAARGRHEVLLWARRPEHAEAMRASLVNTAYLTGIGLPTALTLSADLDAALAHGRAGLTIIATPMAGLREMLGAMDAASPAVWLAKGFEHGSGALGHEIARELRPLAACAVLTGPSFAEEVARGQPTALVAAGNDAALREALVSALHGDVLRVYSSDDIVGAEVGGAVKNVLAIATGICDGLAELGGEGAPGLNARAALVTRGLSEMTRLGVALGARAETFMGLSGLGDLVLTATGALSRNRRVGLQLAQGLPLAQVLQQLGHVAEGVYCAEVVVRRAAALGVDMPLCAAVVEVLAGRATPRQALAQLMARSPRAEGLQPPPA